MQELVRLLKGAGADGGQHILFIYFSAFKYHYTAGISISRQCVFHYFCCKNVLLLSSPSLVSRRLLDPSAVAEERSGEEEFEG